MAFCMPGARRKPQAKKPCVEKRWQCHIRHIKCVFWAFAVCAAGESNVFSDILSRLSKAACWRRPISLLSSLGPCLCQIKVWRRRQERGEQRSRAWFHSFLAKKYQQKNYNVQNPVSFFAKKLKKFGKFCLSVRVDFWFFEPPPLSFPLPLSLSRKVCIASSSPRTNNSPGGK